LLADPAQSWMIMSSITLAHIAALLNCSVPADGSRAISGIATLPEATPDDISFLGAETYLPQFATTKAAAVIVNRRVRIPEDNRKPLLIVDDADLAVAKVLELFAPPVPRPPIGVHPAARTAPDVRLGEDVAIGANVVIGAGTRIGRNTVIHPGVVISEDVTIGDDCEIHANVTIRERITIGNRVIIHSGSVVGTDGFGYRWDGTQHKKVPQIGTVIIEDDVEIGSCVCIDRAKFSSTRVGRGTKIDNLVQVAHNVQTGPHCIIVGQAGMAGSVTLGAGVVLGGQCAVRDHVTMGDGSMVAACSGVAEDVDPKTIVSGLPALPHRQTLREQAALRRLPDLVVQVRKLQEQLEELRKQSK
jgi:UDP-3-O-[3-hydroxymyristoyl] glucosamine N-acyltransferase